MIAVISTMCHDFMSRSRVMHVRHADLFPDVGPNLCFVRSVITSSQLVHCTPDPVQNESKHDQIVALDSPN